MNHFYFFFITLSLLNFSLLVKPKENAPNKTFQSKDLQQLNRISGTTVSANGDYVVFSSRKWNITSGKSATNLYYAPIETPGDALVLTPAVEGVSDTSPVFTVRFPDFVFFLRTQEGRTHIYYMQFPPTAETQPIKLSNYPLDVSNLAIRADTILFSAEMFYECKSNMTCTDEKNKEIEARGDNTYQIYTELMIRHWDIWYTEGKASQVFYQKIKQEGEGISLDGEAVDMLEGLKQQSPPIENGAEQFSISPDGNLIAFSALERNNEMAMNTAWKIYTYNINTKELKNICQSKLGRCQAPLFNVDASKLSMLCMNRAGIESDQLHINIYDINTGEYITPGYEEKFKPAISAYSWYKDEENINQFLLSVVDAGYTKIYTYDFMAKDEASAYNAITNDTNAYGQPILLEDNTIIISYSSFYSAEKIGKLILDGTTQKWTLTDLADLNKDTLSAFGLQDAESFKFKGGNEEEVQGWILKPSNFEEGKKYPLAFLIHGGPEGAWDPAWSYRWNPQLWAHHGYAVVMINPHGSSGMGIEFQDKVRYDWGGLPFKDLMLGLDYVLTTYTFLDKDRVGACGASYGGFMVNWIAGHNDEDKFKCLVTHDGVFSTVTMFYATEELWFPMAEYCPLDKLGCTPFQENEKYREGFTKYSPEQYIDHWHTPHLIIHGALDYRIPISEGISAFTALQMKGIPSKFLMLPYENHWTLKPENSIKWYEEVLGWLDKYLENY